MKGLNLKRVYKDFFGSAAVTDISFEIFDNETVVLAGPPCSGKSVILRLIAGIEKLNDGQIYINGELFNGVPLKKRNIALVFTKSSYFKNKTFYQNLAYGLKLRKADKEIIDEKVNKAAEILELESLNKKPKNLDNNIKQLITIARAVIRRPDVLLVDEPFSDINNAQNIEKFLNLLIEYPAPCVYATRKFEDVKYFNKKTVVLNEGIIQQSGTFNDIYNNPANKFVAEFMGNPKINFFECLIKKENDGLILELFNENFKLPENFISYEFLQKPLIIGLRPEDIKLSKAGDDHLSFNCEINYISEEDGVLIGSVKENGIIIKAGCGIKIDNTGKIKVYINLDKIFLFDKETETNIRKTWIK